MKQMKIVLLSGLMLAMFLSASAVSPTDPEGTVRRFYSWYLHRLNQDDSNPLKNRTEALKYLTPEFLKRVPRLIRSTDADPIICAQDWDRAWEQNFKVDTATTKGNQATVPVQLAGGEMGAVNVKVILKRTHAGWRIDAVDCGY